MSEKKQAEKVEEASLDPPALVPRQVGRATMIEGLPAVTLPLANNPEPPKLSESLKIPLSGGALGEGSDSAIRVPEQIGRGTMIEGLPAIKAPLGNRNRATLQMSPDELPTPEVPETDPEPSSPPPPSTRTPKTTLTQKKYTTEPLEPVSAPSHSRAGTIVATATITSLICGGLFGLVAMIQPQEESPKAELPPDGYRVQVPAGPFFKGLSNDFRLMFGKACKGIAEDPKVECEEKTALEGEIPQETVTEAAFAMDAYEVSNAAYDRCVEAGVCQAPDLTKCQNHTLQGYMSFLRVPKGLRAPNKPVMCVTQAEAEAYCKWTSGQLPTQNQWEKAARGPDGFLFPWGSDWDASLVNWGERDMLRGSVAGRLDGFEDSSPVGSYPEGASKFGALDMAGNVSEWTRGTTEAGMAIARGGSWISNPIEVRTTMRLKIQPDTRRTDVGFRCVATP